jgi:hypothetical protein
MEGISFVTPVTGLSRPNTGKEDEDDGCWATVGSMVSYCCVTIGTGNALEDRRIKALLENCCARDPVSARKTQDATLTSDDISATMMNFVWRQKCLLNVVYFLNSATPCFDSSLQNVNMTVVLAFSLKEITNGPLEIGYFV